nr:uncharacterized protein LOC127347708 [Lolium perenne]
MVGGQQRSGAGRRPRKGRRRATSRGWAPVGGKQGRGGATTGGVQSKEGCRRGTDNGGHGGFCMVVGGRRVEDLRFPAVWSPASIQGRLVGWRPAAMGGVAEAGAYGGCGYGGRGGRQPEEGRGSRRGCGRAAMGHAGARVRDGLRSGGGLRDSRDSMRDGLSQAEL